MRKECMVHTVCAGAKIPRNPGNFSVFHAQCIGSPSPSSSLGWHVACKAFAVLDQTGHLTVTFAILWIILHLNVSLCCLRRLQSDIPQKNVQTYKPQKISRGEVLGICLVFLFPFAVNCIPFVWNMYGLTGTFCWIRTMRYRSCEDHHLSTILMLTMYYVPILLTSLLAFVTVLLIMIVMCRGSVQMMGIA